MGSCLQWHQRRGICLHIYHSRCPLTPGEFLIKVRQRAKKKLIIRKWCLSDHAEYETPDILSYPDSRNTPFNFFLSCGVYELPYKPCDVHVKLWHVLGPCSVTLLFGMRPEKSLELFFLAHDACAEKIQVLTTKLHFSCFITI